MRGFLGVIQREFKTLYGATADADFAMEIEYKVTIDDALEIKQARPWIVASGSPTDPVTPTSTSTPPDPGSPTPSPTTGTPSAPERRALLPMLMNR
jgi:hypothetical protein